MTWNQIPLMVVVVHFISCLITIIQIEHTQPVANGNARCYYQKVICKACILYIVLSVQIIIQDNHSHHNRLPRARSHFKGSTRQDELWVI